MDNTEEFDDDVDCSAGGSQAEGQGQAVGETHEVFGGTKIARVRWAC
jgi:hypothetical protein